MRSILGKLKFWLYSRKAKFSSLIVLTNFDENWFKNKRVAIIGGADSVFKEKLGEYIDGFEVVVRINKGVEIISTQSEYVGKKTDVLFHGFYEFPSHLGGSPITTKLWQEHKVKKLLYARNYNYSWFELKNFCLFLKNTNRKFKFSQLPEDLNLKNMKVVLPSGPTVGFSAIHTIFNCQPKEIYITGITFFKTPHNNGYRNMNNETLKETFKINKDHDAEVEYQCIKSLYLQHSGIIKPDATLKEIFKNN